MKPEYTYTESELNHLCEEWQKILRLQDWIGSVSIVDASELSENRDIAGTIDEYIPHKFFKLKIAEIDTLDPKYKMECNYLITLVHELLHLHFSSVTPKKEMKEGECGEEYIQFEIGIQLTAEALVKLYRENKEDRENSNEI